jgi:hypothetical protein
MVQRERERERWTHQQQQVEYRESASNAAAPFVLLTNDRDHDLSGGGWWSSCHHHHSISSAPGRGQCHFQKTGPQQRSQIFVAANSTVVSMVPWALRLDRRFIIPQNRNHAPILIFAISLNCKQVEPGLYLLSQCVEQKETQLKPPPIP